MISLILDLSPVPEGGGPRRRAGRFDERDLLASQNAPEKPAARFGWPPEEPVGHGIAELNSFTLRRKRSGRLEELNRGHQERAEARIAIHVRKSRTKNDGE